MKLVCNQSECLQVDCHLPDQEHIHRAAVQCFRLSDSRVTNWLRCRDFRLTCADLVRSHSAAMQRAGKRMVSVCAVLRLGKQCCVGRVCCEAQQQLVVQNNKLVVQQQIVGTPHAVSLGHSLGCCKVTAFVFRLTGETLDVFLLGKSASCSQVLSDEPV